MKQINFLFFLVIGFCVNAQTITGKILSKDENKTILYAKIGVENSEIGAIADENGNFNLDLSKAAANGNVKVEVAGFQTYRKPVQDFVKNNSQTIYLEEKVRDIAEVKISPKKLVAKNYGTSNIKTYYCGYDSDKPDRFFKEYAIKVNNRRKMKINKINVDLSFYQFQGSATLIFDIQNEKNGFPDDEQSLCNETLQKTFTSNDIKNNRISIDISDKNIWSDKDFFVLVRIAEGFKGKLHLGGNIWAFSKDTYHRKYYGEWKKFSVGEPAINIDVLVEK